MKETLSYFILFAGNIFCGLTSGHVTVPSDYVIPNVVHQIYDYHSPNYMMYLSIMCVQRFVNPDKHILWINDAGRYRKSQWENWQSTAAVNSWEANFSALLKTGKIESKFLTFPTSPPGNESIFVSNKAHQR